MSPINREAAPTRRQAAVLRELQFRDRATAKYLGVRSDVLWRMEERGWVARNLHEQWYLIDGGRRAMERAS